MKTEKASAFIIEILKVYNKMCKRPEDTFKVKTATHNKAVRRLIAIRREVESNLSLAEEIYSELIKNEDEFIRLDTASRCMLLGFLETEALNVVNETIDHGSRPNAFLAKGMLESWRGESDPNKPWS